MEAGRRLYDKKDYARAILEFKNAAAIADGDAEPSYRLGLAYLASGDVASAAVSFSDAATMDPKHAAAQLRLGQLLAGSNDPKMLQDALRRLKLVLDTSSSSDALNALALTEMKLGKTEDAQQHLEEALARFPQELSSYVVLAKTKMLRRDFAGAEATLKKAVEASPHSADTLVALATFYMAMNRVPEAEDLLQQAVRLDPKNGPALFQLAMLNYGSGRKTEAERLYKQLSGFEESAYKPLHAIYLFKEGDKQGAIAELERLVRENPGNRPLRAQLVAAYWTADRMDKVSAVLETAIKQNPKDFDALLQRSELYLAQEKYTQAQSDLDQVLSYKRDSAPVHYIQAKLHQVRGADLSYRQELTEALRLNPSLLQARLDLAQALILSNGAKSALEVLDEAPAAQRNAFSLLVQRNWAWLALNDYAELRPSVKTGLAIARVPDLLIQDTWINIADRNYAAAMTSVEEALNKAPADTRALQALAAVYTARRQTADLEKRLKQYAEQSNSPEVRLFVGNWILRNGNSEGAKTFFRLAKAADPKFHEADVALALIDISEGKLEAARSVLATVIANRDQDVGLRLRSAVLETVAHRYPEAIDQYKKILAIDRNNFVALNNLAYLLASSNRADEALAYAQQAKEVAPRETAVEDTLGWVLYRKGIYSAALSHLEAAAQKSSDPTVQYHLGLAYFKSGDRERGEKVLRAALKTAPEAPEANEVRQLLGAPGQ
jgi:tetratricopeptide (TPR) repeat protein